MVPSYTCGLKSPFIGQPKSLGETKAGRAFRIGYNLAGTRDHSVGFGIEFGHIISSSTSPDRNKSSIQNKLNGRLRS
jgi:hypothetical protein